MSIIYQFPSVRKRCEGGIEDTYLKILPPLMLISLMSCTLLQRILVLSFGMKPVLKTAKYLVH